MGARKSANEAVGDVPNISLSKSKIVIFTGGISALPSTNSTYLRKVHICGNVTRFQKTRGSYRVVRLASSEQCVSLFSVFLRPLLVQWVECYFDGVAFRGFLRIIPRILTEL